MGILTNIWLLLFVADISAQALLEISTDVGKTGPGLYKAELVFLNSIKE